MNSTLERQLREMNEALLVSSVRQHELAEQARRAESLIQCQKESLELVVKGEPIERVLDFLAGAMESQSQGKFLVAIHLLEADGFHFGYVAAPRLPARYAEATRGMDARLELGFCSSAVVSHAPTIVPDFTDPLPRARWPAFTAEMMALGLRGCFTTPILSPPPGERVLGTFALYYREPFVGGDPSPRDLQLVDLVTSTVAMAIERKQAEAALQESEERYRTLFNAMDEGYCIIEMIFDEHQKPVDYRFVEVNGAFEKQSGMHDVVGKRMLEFVPEIPGPWLPNYGHVALTGEPARFANEYKTLNRWFDVYAFKVGERDGGGRSVAVLFTDITGRVRAEEALRESETKLRLSQQAAGAGAWTWEAASGVITWSEECYELFGTDPQTPLLYESWRNVLHPDDRERADAAMRRAMDRQEELNVEYRINHSRRGERWLTSLGRMIDPVNRPGYMTGICLDITERKQAEQRLHESEVRYRRLFQSSKDGILILDARTGKIIDANAFMSGLLGRDLPEILGKELWEIGTVEDIAASKAAFIQLQLDGNIRYDHLPVQKPSGKTNRVEFMSNVYWEGDRKVAQCNVRDITERFLMEQVITRQAATLADQARHKDEFLAMLAHELRNPLAPIRSATHLLRLQEPGSESALQRQAREVIERQVTNLTRLVSDLMEVSRALTGRIRLDLQIVDLNQVLRHAIETATPLIEERRHTLAADLCSDSIWAKVDPTRMEEVFVNLLGNACKYTAEGGRIEVACEHDSDQALVRVRDNGAGIEPALLPRIFDLFTQGDRTLDRAQGGLGIGLSLAHRLVDLHGGAIEAHSDGPGKGSEFIVRVPRVPAPGVVPPVAAPDESAPSGALRVLVVDDNVDGCQMLAHFVRLRGHSVQTAHTGPAALALGEAWRPDVMLLDIGLPLLDGYEVARRLRAAPATRGIKLVAVSGYGTEKDVALGREAGFDAHLIKPVDLEEIEKLLDAWKVPV